MIFEIITIQHVLRLDVSVDNLERVHQSDTILHPLLQLAYVVNGVLEWLTHLHVKLKVLRKSNNIKSNFIVQHWGNS